MQLINLITNQINLALDNKSKITFIAQFPPPMHGLSKAVETLYGSKLRGEFNFEKINITNNKDFAFNLFKLWRSKSDLYYFTISQTKGGNLRDLIFFRILKFKKANVVIHLHGGYYRKLIDNDLGNAQKRLNYKYLKGVSGAIVLGKSLERIFKGLVPDEKIFEVANCVDDPYLLSKDELSKKLTVIANTPKLKILYLSNFIETKGYKEVLYLAEKAKQNSAPFEFNFAGKFFEPKDEEFFMSFVKDKGLEDYVNYLGIVGGQAKTDLLRDSNVFVLLTRYPNEGQPISILEAMGNGIAIVTTNHAGIPDVVDNIANGLMVDKNSIDVNSIYNYLEELLANRTKLTTIAINNYTKVEDNYTELKYINNMGSIFNKLVQKK